MGTLPPDSPMEWDPEDVRVTLFLKDGTQRDLDFVGYLEWIDGGMDRFGGSYFYIRETLGTQLAKEAMAKPWIVISSNAFLNRNEILKYTIFKFDHSILRIKESCRNYGKS